MNSEIGKSCFYLIRYEDYNLWQKGCVIDSTNDTIKIEYWSIMAEDFKGVAVLPRQDVIIL